MMYLETKEIKDASPEALLLTSSQWDRICSVLTAKECRAAALQAQLDEKNAVLERSKNMTKNWKNTIAGQRKERLEAKKLRLHREEEQKLHLDMQEARYQDRRRKQVLDQCKKKIFFETDRVKHFHSALALTDALIERDKQLVFNRKKGPANEAMDAEFEKALIRDAEMFNDVMRKEKEKKRLKNYKFAEIVKHQIKENSKNNQFAKEAEYIEGREIMEEDERHQLAEIERREERKKKQVALKNEMDIELRNKQLIQEAQKKMEEEDEKRANVFVEAKREMKKLRKQKVALDERIKEERRDRMIKLLNKQVGVLRLKEERSFQKAVEEKKAQDVEKQWADHTKHEQMLKEIDASHKKQIAEKEENRISDMRDELKEWFEVKEQVEEHEAKELEKLKIARRKADQNQTFQVIQKIDKRNKKARELQGLMEERLSHYHSLQEEEEEFQKYAKKIIQDRSGNNIYPLMKSCQIGIEKGKGPVFSESSGIRPRYLTTDEQTTDLNFVPPQKPPVKSLVNNRRRLGFAC